MIAVGATDKGKRRKDNQDNYYIDVQHSENQAFLVVGDGMGGANSGDIASNMAVSLFAAEVRKRYKPGMTTAYMRSVMNDAIYQANRLTYEKSNEDPAYTGMGTTMVAAMVDGAEACILNIGDSRAYHVTQTGIRQITHDHSVAAEMVRRGELSADEARLHPAKNYITRAVGTEPKVEPEFFKQKVAPGDVILLCSDGLSNMLLDEEILFEIRSDSDLSTCPDRLIRIANDRGGPDNITAVILSV
ncbi:MAG: Stp1/IreP family PP2C-type Ser/Thr phosphatase [Clostridia bacterium]|nr:Stp1/IreP family PP2C-type Ser/Thr phosphatase [Clostridia bacterium]